ncbi:MAG TPA: DUF72 domain-containing protein [Dongiaceae bacterium]|nr:DUF72 domain-containing protein [Dongiaceae bacterium]
MLRFGVAGWDYPDWEGVVYPDAQPKGFDRLAFLADFLDVVEINVTFYRQPDQAACRGWVRRLQEHPEFRLTAKLFRGMTHPEPAHPGGASGHSPEDQGALREESARYREGIGPLLDSGRLGAVLAQFPQRLHDEPAARRHLEQLARGLQGLPLVAEFRHRSWDHEEALRFLHGIGIGFCNVDQPALKGALRPTGHVTSNVAYVRLHGRNAENWFRKEGPAWARYDYLYSEEELRPWVERAARLADRAEEVFIIANNHYRGQAPANALMLKAMATQSRVDAPGTLVRTHKRLDRHARSRGPARPAQRGLFEE